MVNFYENIINKWTDVLSRQVEGNNEQNQAIISYAINLVIFNSLVFLATIVPSIVLGTLRTTLTALAAGGSLRIFSGGYHCTKPMHCLLLTSISFNFYGFIALMSSSKIPASVVGILVILVMLLSLCFILRNAPVETPNRPIRPERRKPLKMRSLKVWALWAGILLVLGVTDYSSYSDMILAAGLGIANQTFSISGVLKNENT